LSRLVVGAPRALGVDYTVRFSCPTNRLSHPSNRFSQRLAHQCCMPLSNGLSDIETHMKNARCNRPLKGRLHGAFLMCIFMSDKPFVAEACPPMSHGSASNGLSDIETHIENAPCNRPLTQKCHLTLQHHVNCVLLSNEVESWS
jgi:hypothetical protein